MQSMVFYNYYILDYIYSRMRSQVQASPTVGRLV